MSADDQHGPIRPDTVARTMAEAGEICPACTHPYGRHTTTDGCLATVTVGKTGKAPLLCDCRVRAVLGDRERVCCPEFGRTGYAHTEICPAFKTNGPATPSNATTDLYELLAVPPPCWHGAECRGGGPDCAPLDPDDLK